MTFSFTIKYESFGVSRTWFLSGRDYTGCCSVVEAVFGPALQRRGAMHNLLFHLPFIKPLFAQLAVQDLQKQVPQRLLGTFSTIKQPPPKACANVCAFACVYKWFNTSHKNECPLCKTPFN
jgi:hypothetical protein